MCRSYFNTSEELIAKRRGQHKVIQKLYYTLIGFCKALRSNEVFSEKLHLQLVLKLIIIYS